jgi:hypothetical protein
MRRRTSFSVRSQTPRPPVETTDPWRVPHQAFGIAISLLADFAFTR